MPFDLDDIRWIEKGINDNFPGNRTRNGERQHGRFCFVGLRVIGRRDNVVIGVGRNLGEIWW